MSEYISRFLSLKCSGDVLNALGKMHELEKEITESMGIIKHLKPITLAEKRKYTLIDMCAGNALTSILAVHMLPINAIAIDLKKRGGYYENVKRFEYYEGNINSVEYQHSLSPIIAIAVHPCKTADMIIDIFNNNKVIKHLIMMPCCNGSYQDVTGWSWLHEYKKIGNYDLWTLHLANKIKNAHVRIVTDKKVLSPKNNIIIANRIGE